jgi:hypothetical protein
MRIVLLALACVLMASAAQAQYNSGRSGGYGTGSNPSNHGVGGYTTPRGSYVQPHYQTNPNGTQYDNYGTRGNVNPYTGSTGTRSPRY